MAHALRIAGIIALAATAACSTPSDLTAPTTISQVFGRASVASSVVVTESDIARQVENTLPTNNWVFYTRPGTSTGAFVSGPENPPLGVGSFKVSTPLVTDKAILFNYDHINTRIADISAISYATYHDPASTAPSYQLPSINIEIDKNGGLFVPGDYMTLVYEPVYNVAASTLLSGDWRTWNTIPGIWWATREIIRADGSICAPFVCYISWSDIVAAMPNATILGGFGINQGSGSTGLIAATDALAIAYNGDSWTYDFEPFRAPTSKEECKDGGWRTLKKADGSSFKNQGECIKYSRENSGDPDESN